MTSKEIEKRGFTITGEIRKPKKGEYYIYNNGLQEMIVKCSLANNENKFQRIIVKRIDN